MPNPFQKTVMQQPLPVPSGMDVRLLRPFLEQLRATVAECVQAINSASVPYSPRVASGGEGSDAAAEDPSVYTTLGGTTEGTETADATAWTVGDVDGSDNLKGCWFYAMTRVTYFDTGDRILYGYVRRIKIDTSGKIYAVGAETRVIIDVPSVL